MVDEIQREIDNSFFHPQRHERSDATDNQTLTHFKIYHHENLIIVHIIAHNYEIRNSRLWTHKET